MDPEPEPVLQSPSLPEIPENPELRRNFVKKVIATVVAQVVCTFILLEIAFILHIARFLELSLFVWVAAAIYLLYNMKYSTWPADRYRLLLYAFGIDEVVLCASVAASFPPKPQTAAAILAGLLIGAMSLFVWRTNKDFTRITAKRWTYLSIVLALGVCSSFFGISLLSSTISGIAMLLIACYYLADLQMILGNIYQLQFGIHEYSSAVFLFYADIACFFLHILWETAEFWQALPSENDDRNPEIEDDLTLRYI